MQELCRYIVLHPVRAHLVEAVHLWPWSSYTATAGLSPAPDWLDTAGVWQHFGSSREDAMVASRQFVIEGVGRASPWEQLRGQMWLGDEVFRSRMEGRMQSQSWSNVPSAQTQPFRPTLEEVLQQVSAAYAISRENVLDRSCQSAFQAAVYLLRRAANLTLREVASLAGVSPSRVSHIQRQMEQSKMDDSLRQLIQMYKVKN